MPKGERRTCLLGASLVDKTHPRIELRGRLDELNARIILLQALAREVGNAGLEADLEDVRGAVTLLMACEARDKPFGELTLWGLSEEEIHRRSHRPSPLGHIQPHPDMGRWAAELNLLRTLVREAELCACQTFVDGEDDRGLIRVLNRLSSAFYLLTYKYLPEGYDRVMQFGEQRTAPPHGGPTD